MIVLYTAYRNLGGVEQLIVNLSSELKRTGVRYKVLAPHDGMVWKKVSDYTPPEALFDSESLFCRRPAPHLVEIRKAALAPGDTLLLPNPQDAIRLRWPNPKVLYWNVYPETLLLGYTPPVRWMNRFLKGWMIDRLAAERSLCFMDNIGLRWTRQKFAATIPEPIYLPIPIPTVEVSSFVPRKRTIQEPLRISYLGRAVDWKVLPCAYFLERAARHRPVEAHIFTDSAEDFRRLWPAGLVAPRAQVTYHEHVHVTRLREMLLTVSDLHAAMGTSALEGARLGLPTVVVEAFTEPAFAEVAKYRWLYEGECFFLGAIISAENPTSNGREIAELIQELERDPLSISQSCFSYSKANHDLAAVCARFVALAQGARGRLRSIHRGLALDMVEILARQVVGRESTGNIERPAG